MEDKDPQGREGIYLDESSNYPNLEQSKAIGLAGKIAIHAVLTLFVLTTVALLLGALDYIVFAHFWFWR